MRKSEIFSGMAIVYYSFRVISWCISRLPFPALYCLSGFLCFILRDVIRYRRKVVYNNLRNSFPEKSESEIRKTVRKFYQNLADVILETIKQENLSLGQYEKRFIFSNTEVYEKIISQGKSVIVGIGHCGNWEWMGNALGLSVPVKGYAVVKPLSDKRFDKYITRLRSKTRNGGVISFKEVYRTLVRLKNQRTMTVFAADQTPTRGEINYWTEFLNQDTPFFLGIEKIAKSLDSGVLFLDLQRTGRGYYEGNFQLITDDPRNTKEFEITEKYVYLLQKAIRRHPDNWLWSHRRWKHKRT